MLWPRDKPVWTLYELLGQKRDGRRCGARPSTRPSTPNRRPSPARPPASCPSSSSFCPSCPCRPGPAPPGRQEAGAAPVRHYNFVIFLQHVDIDNLL